MTDITVKKENVLRAFARFHERHDNGNARPTIYWVEELVKDLFSEAFEEEKN